MGNSFCVVESFGASDMDSLRDQVNEFLKKNPRKYLHDLKIDVDADAMGFISAIGIFRSN